MTARRSTNGTSSSTSRLFGQITPRFSNRSSKVCRFSRNRAAETSTAAPSGSSAPSGTCTKMSVTTLPFLTSGIDPLLERFDAEPLHGIDEKFVRALAQRKISFDDILDHIGDFRERNGGPDQDTKLGVLVGAAADGDLIEFFAVLLDAENADMTDMVMAACIDAAGNIDVQPADQFGGVGIGKASRQLLPDRDRTRIRQRAVIEAGTGDDVGNQIDVRRREPNSVERLPQRRQVTFGDMGQRKVLLVPDTDFAKGIFVGKIGERIHLVGSGIARRPAHRL